MSDACRGAAPARWQDGARYASLRGIDRAGLMWEWLRRDPGYIAWYTQASRATRGAAGSDRTPLPEPAAWGLHFR